MTTTYADRTVDDLRDELRKRDLEVSGRKDDLIARLEAADEEAGSDGAGANGRGGSDAPSIRDVLLRIQRELGDVTGLPVERASGLERDEQGWQARVDVVEVSRIPPSTDVLATYLVHADGAGAVTGFDRLHRFRRSEADA